MTLRTLEGYTPYDRSMLYRLNDQYWSRRGGAAWTAGEIPYQATSNFGVARQHAEFIVALVADLEARGALGADDPIALLEIGCGSGQLAVNLLRALRAVCAAASGPRYRRFRYVLSDMSATTVKDALARFPELAEARDEGVVVPALFDLRAPNDLLALDGTPDATLTDARFSVVLGAYVACVAPSKHILKAEHGFSEMLVRVDCPVPAGWPPERCTAEALRGHLESAEASVEVLRGVDIKSQWHRIDLDTVFAGSRDAAVIRRATEGFPVATLTYPVAFMRALRVLGERVLDGGTFLLSDYGNPDREALRGRNRRQPQVYGATINHDVNLSIFEAFADEEGWGCARTTDLGRSLNHAMLRVREPVDDALAEVYRATFMERHDGEDLTDFDTAARQYASEQNHWRAFRYYQRCARLDPDNPDLLYRLGESAIEAGYPEAAVDALQRAMDHDGHGRLDYEFHLGRALTRMGDLDAAAAWYRRSLAREDHEVSWVNLGVVEQRRGNLREAFDAFWRALHIAPDYHRAADRLAELRDHWWDGLTAPWIADLQAELAVHGDA